jgi:biopolymer transport protein ExbD
VAFSRIKDTGRRRLELIPLMDMVFILLIFFLVTMFVAGLARQEQKLDIPTPKNEPGRAQIMIQLLPGGDFVWVDEGATKIVEDVERDFGYMNPTALRERKVEEVLRRSTHNRDDLDRKLEALVERANGDPNAQHFVLIRCPNEIPYYRVVDIIKVLSNGEYDNIKYGCVGGTIEQIRNCTQIQVVREKDRKNLWIDF